MFDFLMGVYFTLIAVFAGIMHYEYLRDNDKAEKYDRTKKSRFDCCVTPLIFGMIWPIVVIIYICAWFSKPPKDWDFE